MSSIDIHFFLAEKKFQRKKYNSNLTIIESPKNHIPTLHQSVFVWSSSFSSLVGDSRSFKYSSLVFSWYYFRSFIAFIEKSCKVLKTYLCLEPNRVKLNNQWIPILWKICSKSCLLLFHIFKQSNYFFIHIHFYLTNFVNGRLIDWFFCFPFIIAWVFL